MSSCKALAIAAVYCFQEENTIGIETLLSRRISREPSANLKAYSHSSVAAIGALDWVESKSSNSRSFKWAFFTAELAVAIDAGRLKAQQMSLSLKLEVHFLLPVVSVLQLPIAGIFLVIVG